MPGKERRKKEADRLRKRQQENAVDSDTPAEEEAIDRKHPTSQQLQALQLQREDRNLQRFGRSEVFGAHRMQQQHEKEAPMRRMQQIRSETEEQKEARQHRISQHRQQEAEAAKQLSAQRWRDYEQSTGATDPGSSSGNMADRSGEQSSSSQGLPPYSGLNTNWGGFFRTDSMKLVTGTPGLTLSTHLSRGLTAEEAGMVQLPPADHPLNAYIGNQISDVLLFYYQHGDADLRGHVRGWIRRATNEDVVNYFIALFGY